MFSNFKSFNIDSDNESDNENSTKKDSNNLLDSQFSSSLVNMNFTGSSAAW